MSDWLCHVYKEEGLELLVFAHNVEPYPPYPGHRVILDYVREHFPTAQAEVISSPSEWDHWNRYPQSTTRIIFATIEDLIFFKLCKQRNLTH